VRICVIRLVGGVHLDQLQATDGVVLKVKLVAAASLGAGSRSADIPALAGACADPGAAADAASGAGQGVGTVFYDDGLRGGIQYISVRDLIFRHHYGGAGNEAGDGHGPIRSSGISTDQVPVAVLHRENRVGNRLPVSGVHLFQCQAAQGFVEEGDRLRVLRVDSDGLGLRGRVDHIAGGRFYLFCHYGTGNAGDADLTLIVGGVEAIGGQVPVVVIHKAAVGIGELELRAGDGFAGHLILIAIGNPPLLPSS